MKKKIYTSPELRVTELNVNDVITASPGAEGPVVEQPGGIWDLDI